MLGDAEALPFATDSRDRYVSTGSIEYWPDPQRAIAEAYRVLRPGGVALLAGPLRRTHPLARALSDAWMLFPSEDEYVAWFERAGFEAIERVHVAPDWWDERWDRYGVAIAAVKPRAGEPPLAGPAPAAAEDGARVTPARLARFAAGSLAGAMFIPVALWFTLVRKLRRSSSGVDDLDSPLASLTYSFSIMCALLAHPEALEDTRRRGVARLQAADHAVHVQLIEGQRQQRGGGLGRIAAGRGGRGAG